jgi:hypothetical protein
MSCGIPDRLLPDRISIRKPVQSMATGTKRPVFSYQTLASGVPARFDPAAVSVPDTVLGKTPRKGFTLFLNPVELKENYEVVDDVSGQIYVVVESKDFHGHHLEVRLEEAQRNP